MVEKKKFETLVSALGTPLYRGERYAIYNDDSLELLKKFLTLPSTYFLRRRRTTSEKNTRKSFLSTNT